MAADTKRNRRHTPEELLRMRSLMAFSDGVLRWRSPMAFSGGVFFERLGDSANERPVEVQRKRV